MDLHYSVYGDRTLSVFAVWITALILLKYRKLNEEKNLKQNELIKQEKSYHQLVDNLIEGAQIIGFDWKYKYLNDSAVKQSGFKREELIGYTIIEKYKGIEDSELVRTIKRCLEERTPAILENEFIYPNGEKGYFKLSIEPIDQGVFILSIDISERKNKERNRELYLKELEEIIFMISHKVRHPVANIIGLSNILDQENNTEKELKEIGGHMKSSAVALDLLTRELAAFLDKSRNRNLN
jgi:PAS domain S-box-containing protein